jgi:hypothetical protein
MSSIAELVTQREEDVVETAAAVARVELTSVDWGEW